MLLDCYYRSYVPKKIHLINDTDKRFGKRIFPFTRSTCAVYMCSSLILQCMIIFWLMAVRNYWCVNVVNRKIKRTLVDGLTESSQLLLKFRIITVGISEIPINQKILHDKLMREGLAKSQNRRFAAVGLHYGTSLPNMLTPHVS